MLSHLLSEPPTIRLGGSTSRKDGKASPTPRAGPDAEPRNAYLGLTSVPIPATYPSADPNGQIAARQEARETLRVRP